MHFDNFLSFSTTASGRRRVMTTVGLFCRWEGCRARNRTAGKVNFKMENGQHCYSIILGIKAPSCMTTWLQSLLGK